MFLTLLIFFEKIYWKTTPSIDVKVIEITLDIDISIVLK